MQSRTRSHSWSAPSAAMVLAISATTGCVVVDEPLADCSVDGQKAFVHAVMSDLYLWADDVDPVDPNDYATVQDLLSAMVHAPVDRWSHIDPVLVRAAFFDEGRFIGLGFQLAQVADDPHEIRIALVHQRSAVGRAGLRRGDRVVRVNGWSIERIVDEDLWATAFGPAELGAPVELVVEPQYAPPAVVSLENDWVELETVHTTAVQHTAVGPAGYLLFTQFLGTSTQELRAAFAEFQTAGVTELVLDLRYNGGGLVSTALLLGSLVAGPEQAGETLVRTAYNDRYRAWDFDLPLTDEAESLALDRLFVITGPGTASASELVINGLDPFLEVVKIGESTYGKPVGADGWYFCGQVISPITFRSLNARDEGDYFDGLPVDCAVADDLTHSLGDADEARLGAALTFIETGACAPQPDVSSSDKRRQAAGSDASAPRSRLITRGPGDPFGWF